MLFFIVILAALGVVVGLLIRSEARGLDDGRHLEEARRRAADFYTWKESNEPDVDPEIEELMVSTAENLGIYGAWIRPQRGREQFRPLQELDDAVYADAFRVLVKWHPEWYRLCILTLKLGNEPALGTLLSSLRTRGSSGLAMVYINSEHPRLVEHGRRWLERHNYRIYYDQTKYGVPARWGGF
ncbi:hypothetical protein [Nonomuraea aridisoli]|uniref:hypothetical protein n=1 Tax=Nonomuraea aridisoli TaxID=2070368 RepID=UPI0011B93EFD|nr:hypothetical protein [Nonomuraea aridisoli]